jgi:hypothetical protein
MVPQFLVNKSAQFFSNSIFTTSARPSSIFSKNQKYLAAMCRVLGVIFFVVAIPNAAALSSNAVDLHQ